MNYAYALEFYIMTQLMTSDEEDGITDNIVYLMGWAWVPNVKASLSYTRINPHFIAEAAIQTNE